MNHVSLNNYISYVKLLGKSSLETLRVNLHRQGPRGIYNLHSDPVNIFFIFSLGRSGTQIFSRILNNDPRATVVHEPLTRDFLEYARTFNENYSCDEYIECFRKKYIQNIISNQNIKVYGEVNSVLRRHAAALMSIIPNVTGLYLIRDGRDVVRSMMARGSMTNSLWYYSKITPQIGDPYFNEWHNMSQFEKCCWVWASENAILYKQFGQAMKFELLLNDYEYFKSNVLDALGLNISKELWQKERLIKSENRTKKFLCESYENWPSTWKDFFWKICGDMMLKNGYDKNMEGDKQ